MKRVTISLRDWFAGQALAGLLHDRVYTQSDFPEDVVTDAYRIADEMLEKRRERDEE